MVFDPQIRDGLGGMVLDQIDGMDGRQRKALPPDGRVSGTGGAEPAGCQLSFPFAKGGARPGLESTSDLRAVAPLPVTGRSRRALQKATPGRRVRLEQPERPLDELRLEQSLLAYMPAGKSLRVALTDNRYTMVMVRRSPQAYTVRLHRMFATAEPKLVRAIARYVVYNDARASTVIGAFIEQHQHVIRRQPRRPRRVVLRTAGRVHDLQALFDRLNQTFFGGTLDARITWGPAPRREGPRRSIKMGSFAVEDRLIRIHPVLDDASVPEYFVAWIIFHEMLHGKHEVVRRNGRRCFHPKAFLADERLFPDYDRACAWERANIDRLLGS